MGNRWLFSPTLLGECLENTWKTRPFVEEVLERTRSNDERRLMHSPWNPLFSKNFYFFIAISVYKTKFSL